MSIKAKITFVFLLSTFLTLSLLTGAIYFQTKIESNEALELSAENKLMAVREARKTEIERYLSSIENHIVSQSYNPVLIAAMSDFNLAFNKEKSSESLVDESASLSSYYKNVFLKEYERLNNRTINISSFIDNLSDRGKALQYRYT